MIDFDGNELIIEEIELNYIRMRIGRFLLSISLEILDYDIVFIDMESLVGSMNYLFYGILNVSFLESFMLF